VNGSTPSTIRMVERQLVFAPPEGGKDRTVPLSNGVLSRITAHAERHPPTSITLPWLHAAGEPREALLLVTGENGRLYSGDLFNKVIWQGAFRAAGLDYRKRADGMHALRHFHASVLLANGVSIKELADYLGHTDPGFTLRTYTHLVPSSFERAPAAVDGIFTPLTDTGDGLTAA
jgi:integrase